MKNHIKELYEKLFELFGPQDWWPADTPWEVAVGAILTQNTNWSNVEEAISNLKKQKILLPHKILNCEIRKLEEALKPSGYFRVKTFRLKNIAKWWLENVKNNKLINIKKGTVFLRNSLLSVNGVGRETADSILLYSFNIPIFVIDAYTRRIASRHFKIDYKIDYDELQKIFSESLPNESKLFNEYHALIVRVGKEFCKKNKCSNKCPLLNTLNIFNLR